MTPNDDRLEVRVDPAFKARLKAAAKADHRSLSSFVISRLEAALSSSETPEAREARSYCGVCGTELERGRCVDDGRHRSVVDDPAKAKNSPRQRSKLQRGSASPSLERFSKAQRKGGKG